jgi:trimeric autotransporter adhesin
MSTKTTIKRIALVAVVALGFGVLPAGVAQAAVSTYTSGSALNTTDMTVVSTTTGAGQGGKFYLDVTGNGASADDLADAANQGLFAGESITVTVTNSATGKTALDNSFADTTDVSIQAAIQATNTCSLGTETRGASAFTAVGTEGTAGSLQVPTSGTIGATDSYASNNCNPDAAGGDDLTGRENRYWFNIYPNRAEAIDGGAFTVRVRVINNDPAGRAFIDKTLTVRFVSSIGNADSVLTLSAVGNHYKGEGLSYATGRYVKATLTNAAGGRVVLGSATANGLEYRDPALNANYMTGGTVVGQALFALDTGIAGEDYIAPSTYPLYTRNKSIGDGVYGITTSNTGFTTATDITEAVSTTTTLRVRITDSAVSSSVAINILAETAARDIYTDLTMAATGAIAYTSTAAITTATAGDVTRTSVDSSTTYVLPLTTKSGTLTVNLNSDSAGTNAAGASVLVTPTWSTPFVSTKVTPATSTTGTSYTADASGNIKVAFTNDEPIDGGQLSLAITGFATGAGTVGTGSRTVVISFQKPVLTSLLVLDPLAGTIVKTGSTTVFTVGAYDQFGNGLAGEILQPSIPTSTHANYVLNKTYPTVTTDANGAATFSLTDAAAEAEDLDMVRFTSITNSAKTASMTIEYATALPVVSTLTMYASLDMGVAATALLSSSGLGASAPLLIETARNQSRDLNSFADHATLDDMVTFKATAVKSTGLDADGAICTVAASAGGHILSSTGLPLSTRNFVVTSGAISWNAIATTPGVKTFTVTCGTATATAKMTVTNDVTDARTVKVTGAATGTANGAGIPVTVTVTDRFGNGVAGVALTLSASGAGSFSGGATTQSFTTDATGSYSFNATSLVNDGGVGTFSVSAATGTSANQFTSIAGYVVATVVDSTVAAGNSTASLAITFAAGESAVSVAAQAAADAAAEATDAANAATDAANAAAEAADAATAAAQDAADAVAALSTQVSEMVNALKKQITALTNLVIKIQKKVRA